MPAGSRNWQALGMRIELLATDSDRLDAAEAEVRRTLDEIDLVYSRFRSDSELAAVNARAGRWTRVSALFGGVLATSLRGARLTGGAVDPTVGAAIRRLGYDRNFADLLPGEPILLNAESVPGWRRVEFEPLSLHVRTAAGVELDFGAAGKAVAVDLAAQRARDAARCGVLVGIGGDLVCAGPTPDEGWQVLACEDSRRGPVGPGQGVAVRGGALATSSTTVRRWRRGDRELHHLLDPDTGLPVDGPFRTATIAAATCVDANLVATWAVVRGPSAVEWIRERALPARLVRRDGRLLCLGGWPEPVAAPPGAGVAA